MGCVGQGLGGWGPRGGSLPQPERLPSQMLLAYANATQRGLDFLSFLQEERPYKTLFVPVNEGFVDNMVSSRGVGRGLWPEAPGRAWAPRYVCPQTLSGPDLELHASNTTFLSANASWGTLLRAHSGLSLLISAGGPSNSSSAATVSVATAPPLSCWLGPSLTCLSSLCSTCRPPGQLWLAVSLCGTC